MTVILKHTLTYIVNFSQFVGIHATISGNFTSSMSVNLKTAQLQEKHAWRDIIDDDTYFTWLIFTTINSILVVVDSDSTSRVKEELYASVPMN